MSDKGITPEEEVRVDLTDPSIPPGTLLREIGKRVQGIEQSGGLILTKLQNRSKLLTVLVFVCVLAVAVMIPTTVVAVKASNRSTNAVNAVCKTAQDNRDLLGQVVVAAYNNGGAGGLDLTKLPSYPRLDPATKAWVDDFQRIIALGSSQGIPNDKNKNKIPDEIDSLLAQKICDEPQRSFNGN